MNIIYRILSFVTCLVFLTGLFLIPINHVVAEKEGKGPHKTPGPTQRPPGWDKGEKEGWDGKDEPPGIEDKGERNKDKGSGTKKAERETEKEQKKERKKAEKAKKKREGAEKETEKESGDSN
ncbi:MAG TPA: hypothetical protein ACFYD2_07385 [Candidatus Avalokitesvara rifleensis]|uniref:hypothetical protein n=1 Tax=Candidatus Avalokitesvara rifleensis TaxID=3367620 RepID=UPI002713F5E9|nr:hypothetical protein [Candidatus Brocadiales bacterium]